MTQINEKMLKFHQNISYKIHAKDSLDINTCLPNEKTKSFKSLPELLQRLGFSLQNKTNCTKFHRIVHKGTLSKNIFTIGLILRFSCIKFSYIDYLCKNCIHDLQFQYLLGSQQFHRNPMNSNKSNCTQNPLK